MFNQWLEHAHDVVTRKYCKLGNFHKGVIFMILPSSKKFPMHENKTQGFTKEIGEVL